MQANAVGWFEIYVDDLPRARAFYEAVFATNLEKLDVPPGEMQMQMWSFAGSMESYGAMGALVSMQGVKAGNNSTLVYFSCVDCSLEESRVVTSGGSVVSPKVSIGENGFISLVTDTEGNMIGLHSMQ
ncbi:VOC family protein [Alginatibacterium sediminis]|uniref:VOC family protein n=1 Tax=Alginatibacterium sediminis TaxID=2164068 RepID=A0A420EDH3_9ALTE|nr:VOC family protein [Alginatibacterium sediminis]RKF18721.1 VOC family protein [Alginatibacterium sediminis]